MTALGPDELIRIHIGNLVIQIVGLQAENAALKAQLETLRKDGGATQPAELSAEVSK